MIHRRQLGLKLFLFELRVGMRLFGHCDLWVFRSSLWRCCTETIEAVTWLSIA